MSVTAQILIDGAFDLCGVKQPGESLTTADNTDALRRLNNLVRILNNQNLISSFQGREVWPLLAGKGIYTIGPGGDFDTTEPAPRSLEGVAILQNPTISAELPLTFINLTTNVFHVAGDETGAFPPGTPAIVQGGVNDGSYTVINSGILGPDTFIQVDGTIPSATFAGMTIQALTSTTSTVEIPRTLYTDNAWQAIQVKSLSNSLPTGVYFSATYTRALALIQLWPIPNVATNALVLYLRNQLAIFADLTTSYEVPEGFEELLEYNLATRLLTPYAISDENVRSDIFRGAAQAMAIVKRTNQAAQINDMPIDPAWTHDRRGYYNINTGNF